MFQSELRILHCSPPIRLASSQFVRTIHINTRDRIVALSARFIDYVGNTKVFCHGSCAQQNKTKSLLKSPLLEGAWDATVHKTPHMVTFMPIVPGAGCGYESGWHVILWLQITAGLQMREMWVIDHAKTNIVQRVSTAKRPFKQFSLPVYLSIHFLLRCVGCSNGDYIIGSCTVIIRVHVYWWRGTVKRVHASAEEHGGIRSAATCTEWNGVT